MSGRPEIDLRVYTNALRTLLMAFAVLALFLGHSVASAQVLYGSITGTVADKTGAVIPGEAITLTNQGTGEARSTVAGSAGT